MVHWTPYRVLRAGWLLFYVGWPHVGALIAWGGETILRGSSPAPYLEAVGWTEYGYAVTDRFFMQPGLAPVRALPFLVGAPIGFALALPGFATGSHAIRVIVAISSAIALASLTVALAAARFSRAKGVLLSIELHPSWHVVVLQNTVATDGLWDVAMDLCPYVMCVLLARSAYGARPVGASRRQWLQPLCVGALVLPLAALLGSASAARNASTEVLIDSLSNPNEALGGSLIQLGDHFAAQRDVESATQWYRQAEKERGFADQAALRIRSLSGHNRRDPRPRW